MVLLLVLAGPPLLPGLSLSVLAQDEVPDNLLVNPGFERAYHDPEIDGMRPMSWRVWPWTVPGDVDMYQDDSAHHNGSRSATIRSSNEGEVRWYQDRHVEPGVRLPFGGWVRADLEEGSFVDLRVRVLDERQDTLRLLTVRAGEDVPDWEELRGEPFVTGLLADRVRFEAVIIGPGQAWFDDCYVGVPTDMGNPPIIVSVPPLEAAVGKEYGYNARAVDLEGDAFAFSLERGPAGMTVTAGGRVVWTPQEMPEGAVKVVLRVTDEGNASSFQDFFLRVAETPVQRPIYAYMYSPYADPFNDGLSPERYDVLLPMLADLASELPELRPSVTVMFMGPDVTDPGQGRADAISNLSAATGTGLVEVGYHSFHEPTYATNPMYDPGYREWTWAEKVTAFDRLLSRRRDPLTGEEMGFGKGGLQAVLEALGDVSAVAGAADDGAQLHALSRYEDEALVVRIGDAPPSVGNHLHDPANGTLLSMLSEDPRAPFGTYWQDGRLVMAFDEVRGGIVNPEDGPGALWRDFDRRRVTVMPVVVMGTRVYCEWYKHVDGFRVGSPTEWAYAHPEDPGLPPEAVWTEEERQALYAATCATLRVLAEEMLPEAGGRFLSSSGLMELVDPSGGTAVSAAELASAASDLLDRRSMLRYPNWEGVSWGYCRGDYQYFSLTEMYDLLLRALDGYDGTGALPASLPPSPHLAGPWGGSTPSQPWQRVRLSDVVVEAVGQLEGLDGGGWSVTPRRVVPATSSVRGTELNSMEFLHLMAEAYIVLYEGRGSGGSLLNVLPTRPWPVTHAVLEHEGRGSHPGDSWGLKPATSNLQLDEEPPVVRYVSPADGAGRVPLDTSISVTFSERMDETLPLAGAVVLDPPTAVDVAWVYHRLIVDPPGDLADNTTYTVTLRRTLKDAAGNPLATEVSWSFSTVGLDNIPPILLPWPEDRHVEVLENRTARFGVIAEDEGPPPLSYAWRLDGLPVDNATGDSFVYATSYTDEGNHTVTVFVSDGADPPGTSSFTWNVKVVNVNLPPRLAGTEPGEGAVDLVETATGRREFRVNAEDPDEGHLEFTWLLDGEPVPEGDLSVDGSVYTYRFDFDSAGNHTLGCQVRDRAGEGFDLRWTLRVQDVNRLPSIHGISPDPPPTVPLGRTVRVTVNASDPDDDLLSYEWQVDSVPVLTTTWPDWNFTAQSSGSFTIEVWVSDGRGEPVQAFTAVNVLPESPPPPEPRAPLLPWLLVLAVVTAIILVLAWPLLSRRKVP